MTIKQKLFISEDVETEEEAIDFVKNSVPIFFESGDFEFMSVSQFSKLLHRLEQKYTKKRYILYREVDWGG